jgi:hypothetical protein
MSTDGTVSIDFPRNSIYPKLEFSCAHPDLLFQWQKLFKKVGLKSFIIRSKITWSGFRGFGIKELKSIRRFIEIGGFIVGVKITGKSKYYKGVTKNRLLKIVFNLNEKSFQFPEEINIEGKNFIIREMINNSIKYREWLNIGIEYPKIKKKIEKEKIKQNILDFVRIEVSKQRFPTYKILKKNFKINVNNYFEGGIWKVYMLAGVKTRREFIQDKIINYVKESAEKNYFPTGDEIDRIFHTNFRQYFSSIVNLYERANIVYPRTIKTNKLI